VLAHLVEALELSKDDFVVEIGPGEGALTYRLLDKVGRLEVIEIDRDLAAGLDKVKVHVADALEFDYSIFPKGVRIVGNLPYNISTPILFHLLQSVDHIADQHVMLQKEVVDRMVASPGRKDYGRLSVMLQWRYAVEHVLDVAPEAFDPPPRVDSAVVRMAPKPAAAGVDPKLLGELVTVAFSQRRKLLRHTLGRWLAEHGVTTDFDMQRRAEEVPVEEYLRLAAAVGIATPEGSAPPSRREGLGRERS
jgi:16S rRNA (adenine1518-N6/adenine1519-N6)-dimethyltransferase